MKIGVMGYGNMNSDFVTKYYIIKSALETLYEDSITDYQFWWEFLKYETRKFLMELSRIIAKNTKKETLVLENKLEMLETTTKYNKNLECVDCKTKLDKNVRRKN